MKNSWLGLFSLLICLMGVVFSSSAEAAEKTTKIMIHRITFFEEQHGDITFDNNGQALKEEELLEGRPLEGAAFSVYDVSSRFYELTAAGMGQQEAQKKISDEADQAVETGKLSQYIKLAESKTGKDGIATFELATYHSAALGKVYLFMETAVPQQASYKAGNLVVGLPYAAIGSDNLLHLYPKNQQQFRRPFFYKYGRQSANPAEDRKLAGAEFRVYKELAGKTYYLHKDKYNNSNAWVEDEKDTGILQVTSDENGLVALEEYPLPAGTYFFEEIKAPEGYEITAESKKVMVEIPANISQPIQVTVGSISGSMDEAKVINLKKTEEPPAEPGEPDEPAAGRLPSTAGTVPASRTTRNLPQTGMQQGGHLILLGVIFAAASIYIIMKRKQTKEER